MDLRTAPDVSGSVIFSIKKENILSGLLRLAPACSGLFWVKGRLGFFIVSHLMDIFFR
jgi:hypothetical protein